MKVRLGYVSIALNLPNITTSSKVTFSYYNKLQSDEEKIKKLVSVTRSNLDDLYTVLKYNVSNEIFFYRITSSLIPLATHPDVTHWRYREIFKKHFNHLGEYIINNKLRVDTHPNEFNVVNSTKFKTVENTKRNLLFHANLFEDLKYPLGKMILHIGSGEGGKEEASLRFINNFRNYPSSITSKIILENDDKTFTAKETLEICNVLNIPMVLDVHHHNCNNNGEIITGMLEGLFNTWKNEELPPKLHYSSPRDGKLDRKHADYIEVIEFIDFIEGCKNINRDIDIMLEAKSKDLALFKLAKDIKIMRPNWKWINESTFIV